MPKEKTTTIRELEAELQELRHRLYEANETIEAIRLGQVDALVVEGEKGNQLYTLKTADQLYRIFIEKMAEGAVTMNEDGIILFCNSRFASILNESLPNVLGRPFRNFVPERYIDEFERIFHRSWEADHKQELQLRSKDQVVPVQLSFSPLIMENEKVLSIIITDLSQQKAAQDQLEQTNRLLEETNKALENSNHDLQQFASVASHDMQEPLRKMHLLLSVITDTDADKFSDQTTHQMKRIMQVAARMRALVVDVLNYSRLSSDPGPFTTISLDDLLKEVLEDLDLLISDKGAVIELSPMPVLQGNKGQIRQVVQNLVVNALKFAKPGSPPKISISGTYLPGRSFDAVPSAEGPWCLIRIRDEGIGFNEEFAEKIFSLFTRLHSKDQYEGTGIGLAIAKRIVEGHGGLITARSRENVGTEFLILLPTSRSPAS